MKTKKLFLSLLILILLGGCDIKEVKDDFSKMPGDKPYNRVVMETENGYYYNVCQNLSLRYKEKKTGKDIFLCAKPECMHDGNEKCTATYNFLEISNSILYENNIYFVASIYDDETMGYALFKASTDGASLDKVGDVITIRQPQSSDDNISYSSSVNNFIIHKGYAYISYVLGQHSYTGFLGAGMIRMNITSGETESIYSYDDYFSSSYADIMSACGEYVYYRLWGNSSADSGVYRYNTDTHEIEKIQDKQNKIDNENGVLDLISEDTLFYTYINEDDKICITGFDSKTFEPAGVEINTGESIIGGMLFYEDKIFVCGVAKITAFDKKGQKIGSVDKVDIKEIDISSGAVHYYDYGGVFDISDGKLYVNKHDETDTQEIYCCKVEDVLKSESVWEKAYTIESWENYWDEYPMFTVMRGAGY
ncbi:MAG: hypothetical protein E7505_05995 [Ruminococcus sp.]|nr:hypothetical protein [Ruminococcus sp.]